MNILVVYYSHAGITGYVAHKMGDALEVKGKVSLVALDYARGRLNPFFRVFYRMFPNSVSMEPVQTDLKEYDLVFLGVSVLGASASPIMIKYLNKCSHLKGKRVICCYIYGIESNARLCAKRVGKLLAKKGTHSSLNLFLQWKQAQDEEHLGLTAAAIIKHLQ